MLTPRRAGERLHQESLTHEAWLTFHAEDRADRLVSQLQPLELLREGRLHPRAAIRETRGQREVITYVREGAVTFEDATGDPGVIRAGEFQRLTAAGEAHYRETNPSPTRAAHIFQLWLRLPDAEFEPGHELVRFTRAERRDRLCVVASPDGREGSLHLHRDAVLYSSILESGRHLVHELAPERSAWLHMVTGSATIGDLVMGVGDGVAITDQPAVALTATEPTEILLLELGAVAMRQHLLDGTA